MVSDIGGESRKIRARIGELSTPPDHPRSLLSGMVSPSPSGCLRATSEFLFLGTRGAAADESGGGSAVITTQ